MRLHLHLGGFRRKLLALFVARAIGARDTGKQRLLLERVVRFRQVLIRAAFDAFFDGDNLVELRCHVSVFPLQKILSLLLIADI